MTKQIYDKLPTEQNTPAVMGEGAATLWLELLDYLILTARGCHGYCL